MRFPGRAPVACLLAAGSLALGGSIQGWSMNGHGPTRAATAAHGAHFRRAAIVGRVVLALSVCGLGWLCVRAALVTERAAHLFRNLFRDASRPELSGFFWQHPHLLLGFAVVVVLAALFSLAVCRVQRVAVVSASVALGLLLLQWLVVTTWVSTSTLRVLQKAAQDMPK